MVSGASGNGTASSVPAGGWRSQSEATASGIQALLYVDPEGVVVAVRSPSWGALGPAGELSAGYLVRVLALQDSDFTISLGRR